MLKNDLYSALRSSSIKETNKILFLKLKLENNTFVTYLFDSLTRDFKCPNELDEQRCLNTFRIKFLSDELYKRTQIKYKKRTKVLMVESSEDIIFHWYKEKKPDSYRYNVINGLKCVVCKKNNCSPDFRSVKLKYDRKRIDQEHAFLK